jgi:heptosyltransferase-2
VYDKIETRILIVKLDAMGDVLRTTCILPGLKRKHPKSHITWLTRAASVPLFGNNAFVDRVLEYSAESMFTVQSEEFDLVLGLDAELDSARIVALSRSGEKMGFGLNARGYSVPLNEETMPWYVMGLFDDEKKANARTYQDHVLSICGLTSEGSEIIYTLSAEEKIAGAVLKNKWMKGLSRPLIGLNVGSGKRWVNKRWPTSHGATLARTLLDRRFGVVLLGGSEEREINEVILRDVGQGIVSPGTEHTVREFGAIMEACDIVVTTDTFSLHLALALKKKVIALFGPTSAVEIEMYGQGHKLTPKSPCSCYYRKACTQSVPCMETISPAEVFEAIESLAT